MYTETIGWLNVWLCYALCATEPQLNYSPPFIRFTYVFIRNIKRNAKRFSQTRQRGSPEGTSNQAAFQKSHAYRTQNSEKKIIGETVYFDITNFDNSSSRSHSISLLSSSLCYDRNEHMATFNKFSIAVNVIISFILRFL